MAAAILDMDIIHRWDNESLAMLYRNFYKALVGYAIQMIGDMTAAEDIVQEVMFGIWNRKNTYPTPGTMKAYLYNAVRNESINHLRHQQVKQDHIPHLEQEFREMQTDDNGEVHHKEELYRQLFMAIDAMPPKQRDVFLQIMDGKKNHEIAAAMQISINTVKKIRQRGMDKLRGQLAPETFALLLALLP